MHRRLLVAATLIAVAALITSFATAWSPLPVKQDPLVRMPGSQQAEGVTLEAPGRCLNCHSGYNSSVEPGFNWKGSMMAQSARDFIYWACITVAGQDSIWAIGRPNAVDICERCHFPKGWLEGRSDPTNASAMSGADFDGVQCDFCHTTFDPFYDETFAGTREGTYWDETNASSTPSAAAAQTTYQEDTQQSQGLTLFNGEPFYVSHRPFSSTYTENGAGQFFNSTGGQKRASFADAAARHQMFYSRYHKSRYFCSTCHDVSNPVLANLGQDGSQPLTTELQSASSYFHVERTFSEFMLSAYGQDGGAAGKGPFAPASFDTSNPGDVIQRCQDCHMRDVIGTGCNKNGAVLRPNESVEHPLSGQPLHDLTGGNVFVSTVLASATAGSPNYDATNAGLLNQGAGALTLDLSAGEGIDPVALLAGADRAAQQLQLAATIENLSYDSATGRVSFRVQNNAGHKLISGFPEGRRMFLNIKAYAGGQLVYEVNPYDATVGTLKGLPADYSPSSPPLGANQAYVDELVYEMHPTSTLTGEESTFHFALADGRFKDNRIPPKGFRIAEAAARLSEPVWHGAPDPSYYTSSEYAGGYDDVSITVPTGADGVEVDLYYQTTSREYVEFLRDEINGTASTLWLDPATGLTPAGDSQAYIIQSDSFFAQLRLWGDTLWQLWDHNKNLPGAAPFLMTHATFGNVGGGCTAPRPTLLDAVPGHNQVALTWSDEHTGDPSVTGYRIYYDQGGKAQLVASVGLTTSYVDSGLTDGQTYCYVMTSVTAGCESADSNVMCATPAPQQQGQAGVSQLESGRYETTGQGRNKVTVFVAATSFTPGDQVVLRALIVDAASGQPVEGVSATLTLTGPESTTVTTGLSTADGIADATWQTTAPRRNNPGTTPGTYTATVSDVSGGGWTWDGVATSTTFSLQ